MKPIVINRSILLALLGMARSHIEDIESGIAERIYNAADNTDLSDKQKAVFEAEALLAPATATARTFEELSEGDRLDAAAQFHPFVGPDDGFLYHKEPDGSIKCRYPVRTGLVTLMRGRGILKRYGDHAALTVRANGLYSACSTDPSDMAPLDAMALLGTGFMFDKQHCAWKVVESVTPCVR